MVTIDYFLIVASTAPLIQQFYEILTVKYTVKRLGRPVAFLGWSFTHVPDGIILASHPALVQATITNARITASLHRHTLYSYDIKLFPLTTTHTPLPEVTETDLQLVRDLLYLADSTRPDLSYVTGNLCTAVNPPTTRHWHAIKSKIRYIIQTAHTGILFQSERPRAPNITLLSGYSDSSFENDLADRKSTPGYLLTFNHSPVAYHFKNKNIVALSTAEAEYISLAAAIQAILAIKRMILQIGVTSDAMVALHTDNKAVGDMMAKPFGTKIRKFFDLRHRFLQDSIEQGLDSIEQGLLAIKHVPVAKK